MFYASKEVYNHGETYMLCLSWCEPLVVVASGFGF